ncbi:OmpA family protein [Leucothrix mucor]|uniref:OmpA family protein n=1 Tax=Leucothrix mucor TaxID=45248 RepID=UPI0003B711B5|nr:OmpA family protein [Leucothrix mucor]
MKKLLIALVAILALLVLGWFAVYQVKGPAIEADIQQRAQRELIANNMGWAKATADGRDVIVSGVAESSRQQRQALTLVKVRGVNQVIDQVLTEQPSAAVEVLKTDVAVTVITNDGTTGVTPVDTPMEIPLVTEADQLSSDIPYRMQIQRDEAGLYTINGVSSGMEFQQAIEAHLQSIGADPNQTTWSLQESALAAPEDWQENVKDSISALQYLRQGSVSIIDDKALVKGIASSQDASDAAEAYAQRLAGTYATEMVLKTDAVAVVAPVAQAPIVGSNKYVEKFCQGLLNEAVKQGSIQFESGSVTLPDAAKSILAGVVEPASRCPAHRIYINGYTDSYGDAKANKALSQARAESVMAYLVNLGVQSARLEAQGFGESKPIANNKTEAGRAKNRRIELIVKGTQ